MNTKRIRLETVGGALFFEVSSPEEQARIAGYGDERLFLEYFLSRLAPADIVFDIGASVGLFSLHAALRLEGGRVYAFEPDPAIRQRLLDNHALNRRPDNCCFVSWAVSDRRGEAILYSEGLAGPSPSLRRLAGEGASGCDEVAVTTLSLDEAIAEGELPVPDVVKIDIEGAEILCLKGASKLLHGGWGKRPRLVFLETHPDYLPAFGSDVGEVFGLLAGAGYAPVWRMERFNQSLCCFERQAVGDQPA